MARYTQQVSMALSFALMQPQSEKALELAEIIRQQMREGRITEMALSVAASVYGMYKMAPEMVDVLHNIAELSYVFNLFLQPQPLYGSGILIATNLPFISAVTPDVARAEYVAGIPEWCKYIQLSLRRVETVVESEASGGEEEEEGPPGRRGRKSVLVAIQCLESYPPPQPPQQQQEAPQELPTPRRRKRVVEE